MYTAKYFDLISSGTIDWGIIFCETTLGGTISMGTKFETLKFELNLIFFSKNNFPDTQRHFSWLPKIYINFGIEILEVHKKNRIIRFL